MNRKRWISGLLSLCIILSALFPGQVMAQEQQSVSQVPREVKLSLYSNLKKEKFISGLYQDNIFYITVEDACKIAGGQVVEETEQQIVFMVGNRVRKFVIDLEEPHMMEEFYLGHVYVDVPVLIQDGKAYISSVHFLNYLDAMVYISPDTYPQFIVFKQYDIYDAIGELAATDSGYFFWWDEVDAGEENLEKKLLNAGGVALIDRESNFLRLLIKAEGIAEEALQDALISIIKNEEQNQDEDDGSKSDINDFLSGSVGVGAGVFEMIAETLLGTTDPFLTKVKNFTTKAAAADGAAAAAVGRMADALESRWQFNNITEAQKNLLKETILAHPEDSKTIGDGWENVYEAAKKVDRKVQSEFDANYETAWKTVEKIIDDYVNTVAGVWSSSYGAVDLAWSGIVLLTQNLPFTQDMIDHKTQLYNAYNCSIIQLIAQELFIEAFSDLYYANRFYEDVDEQEELLNRIKYAMILQLKSTLTTREYLIKSGFLEKSYAEEMEETNEDTKELLRKIEGCKVLTVDDRKIEYDVDLTWMENAKNTEKKILKSVEVYEEGDLIEKKEYNELGQLILWNSFQGDGMFETKEYLYSDKGINTNVYLYDSLGKLKSEEKYDEEGKPLYSISYMGQRSRYDVWEYNNVGELIHEYSNICYDENVVPYMEVHYKYDSNGIKKEKHGIYYDPFNEGANSYKEYGKYNKDEQIVEEQTLANDRETFVYYQYDFVGNIVEKHTVAHFYQYPESNYETWYYFEYTYDIAGNMVEEYTFYCNEDKEKRDERWTKYVYEYDLVGNILSCREYSSGELIYTTYYTYYETEDLENSSMQENVQEVSDRNLSNTIYVLESTSFYWSNGKLQERMEYTYDDNGKIISAIAYDTNGEIGSIYEYSYEKDFRGNDLEKEYRYSAGDGRLLGWVEHEYDETGKEIRTREYGNDGDLNAYFSYEYDEFGRVIRMIETSSAGTEIDYDYEYDSMGNCYKMYMNNIYGEITHWFEYEYDENGNVTKEVICEASGELYGWKEYQYTKINVNSNAMLTEDEALERVRGYWESLGKNMPDNVECEGIDERGYCFWGYNMSETHANTHFRICVDLKTGRLYDITYDKYLN